MADKTETCKTCIHHPDCCAPDHWNCPPEKLATCEDYAEGFTPGEPCTCDWCTGKSKADNTLFDLMFTDTPVPSDQACEAIMSEIVSTLEYEGFRTIDTNWVSKQLFGYVEASGRTFRIQVAEAVDTAALLAQAVAATKEVR